MLELTIVVPCFNEEDVIAETTKQLLSTLDELVEESLIQPQSHVLYIDDSSLDATWELISQYSEQDPRVRGVQLSKNKGHQIALLAGLEEADGDITISMDADLQDDPRIVREMVLLANSGKDIVFGVRGKRETDSFFKRSTAELYYRVLKLFGVDLVFNHADCRLMNRRALDALKEFREVNLFLRGMVPTLGFSTALIEYDRLERFAGVSKYPLRKMLALAVDGVTSFSSVPLRVISMLGIGVFLLSILLSFWVLWVKLGQGNAVPGWASSVLPMYILGGIQLFCIGVVGEYVAKSYLETKRRPRYFVRSRLVRSEND